jgi:hypothetical protein
MVSREEIIKKLGPGEEAWLGRCQLFAVMLFVTLFFGVLLFSPGIPGAPESTVMAAAPPPETATVGSSDTAVAP